jgi:NadR type nicotinamide-nucleotide adenylyltransferase
MEKNIKYKNGFLLGKFFPPHLGHCYLMETAASMCEHLTVMVCSLEKETISGKFRFECVTELMMKHHNVSVIHITDELPQEPNEHPNFWDMWIETVRKNVTEKIDVVFSSEMYGYELAERLGAEHFMVDLDRKTFPVSGTKIRNNPYEYWSFIPDIVKPYFVKRIAILGPESVGKTVISEKLSKHYNTRWVPEYGREYTDKFKLTLDGICTIANKQLEIENQVVKDANKILICDTDIITTKIWSLIYFKTVPKSIENMVDTIDYDLYLVLSPDVPWVDDGTRVTSHMRDWHFETIKSELNRLGKQYQVISGNYDNRLSSAIKEIDILMKPKVDFQYPLW